MAGSIRHCVSNITRFSGRDTRSQFWPYVALIIVLDMAASTLVMVPVMGMMIVRSQAYVREHPDGFPATGSEPGSFPPGLMPDFKLFGLASAIIGLACVLALAAAVSRRLHDRGRTAYWGLLPLPFLAFGMVAMGSMFATFPAQPDMRLFGVLMFNNLAYMAALILLIVFLASATMDGPNRFGPDPRA